MWPQNIISRWFICDLCAGGWAILYVPPSPGLVGQTLAVTCRVRGTPPLREVILFKDGEEVMRQEGLNPHFNLTNLVLEDNGVYYCRASWDTRSQTHSVISVETPVRVVGEFTVEFECSCRSHIELMVWHSGARWEDWSHPPLKGFNTLKLSTWGPSDSVFKTR